LADRVGEHGAGALVEGRDADDADIAAFDAGGHGAHVDDLAGERHVERIGSFARDRHHDLGAGLAAHALHGLVEGKADNGFAIDGGQEVAGLDAGASGGRAVDRGNDAHDAIFARHLDAEAAIFAAGGDLHVAVLGRVHVGGMRVERGEHAVDRRFDSLALVDVGDIILLDAREHVGEQFKLTIDVALIAIARSGPSQSADAGRQSSHRGSNPS
jgi:hypothetical protein